VHHLREAKEGGVGAAALALGDAHLVGQGCDQSDRQAFLLYRRAAMLGEAQSLKRLADCYARGAGTDIDPTKPSSYCAT
jgi:TPR repeat protein